MAKHIPIPIGSKFGQWTVVGVDGKTHNTAHTYYSCQCACGNTGSITADRLRRGHATKCHDCANLDNGKNRTNAHREKYPNAPHMVPHDSKDSLHRKTSDGEATYRHLKESGYLDE